jgi:hypothetical protein
MSVTLPQYHYHNFDNGIKPGIAEKDFYIDSSFRSVHSAISTCGYVADSRLNSWPMQPWPSTVDLDSIVQLNNGTEHNIHMSQNVASLNVTVHNVHCH